MKQILLLAVVVLIAVSLLPVTQSETTSFASPVFQQLWSAQSAAAGSVDLWGGEPLIWRIEPYADAPDGRRLVQYFDRGRMELTQYPGAGQPRVTQGLIARELTTGEIQLGNELYERKDPPNTAVDSGAADPSVATYAGLSAVVGARASDRSGDREAVRQWIDATGTVTEGQGAATVRLSVYVDQSGHNLPDVFTELFDHHPFGQSTWVDALGYPISEPYWTVYRRDDTPLPSLIQVFERRILVYTPSLPADRQVTAANVGRHYYRWRYGEDALQPWPTPRAGTASERITVPDGFMAGVYAQHLGTPVGLAIGPTGNLWLVTQQGAVVEVVTETGDGAAGKTVQFAQGLPNPRGIAVVDNAVYVTTDDGVIRLEDVDGDGVADRQSKVSTAIEPAPGTLGAPVVDASGHVYAAGTLLGTSQQRVVAELGAGSEPQPVASVAGRPGPLRLASGSLYVVDQPDGGTPRLYRLSLGPEGPVTPATLVAEFTRGFSVSAVHEYDSTLWPQVPRGTIFAAVVDGSGGRIVRTSPGSGSLPDIVDFSTGFQKPVALAVGLDGALYVADAGSQQVIKIVAAKPATP